MDDVQKFKERSSEKMPVPIQENSFLATIERLASRPDIDPDKIKQFMDMQERILDRNAKQAFNIDMMNAQREMPIVPTDANNQQTNSKYSLYKTILKKAKPIYTKYGFSIMFYEGFDSVEGGKWPPIPDGEIRTFADVMHREGHTKTVYIDMPTDDKGIKGSVNKTLPHAKKSSISYSRGALVCMVFNISTGQDDDDGNAAGTPVEYITLDQQTEINDAIAELYTDGGKKFMEFLKVESVETIPAKRYKETISALNTVRKSRPKK